MKKEEVAKVFDLEWKSHDSHKESQWGDTTLKLFENTIVLENKKLHYDKNGMFSHITINFSVMLFYNDIEQIVIDRELAILIGVFGKIVLTL